jgi:hypothetical protein
MSAKPRVIWLVMRFNNFYPMQRMRPARFEGKQWVLFGELIDKRADPDPVQPHMGPRVGARVDASRGAGVMRDRFRAHACQAAVSQELLEPGNRLAKVIQRRHGLPFQIRGSGKCSSAHCHAQSSIKRMIPSARSVDNGPLLVQRAAPGRR